MTLGGHTLLALAAKGNRIVVSNQEDMDSVVKQLLQNGNEIKPELRQRLIVQAYEKIKIEKSSDGDQFLFSP